MTPLNNKKGPYRGLSAYDAEDAELFFGRDRERETIAANLLASPLTILYGPSGVGKSSVLSAGVEPYIRNLSLQGEAASGGRQFIVTNFSSWRGEPLPGLLAAIAQQMDIAKQSNAAGTLADKLRTWSLVANSTILIILDQFEEYFLYHADEDGPNTFAADFPDAVSQRGLRAHFLLSIREESLARLDRFKGKITGLFNNYLRLDQLDRQAATSAICDPISAYNRIYSAKYEIEGRLVGDVLDEIRNGSFLMSESGMGTVLSGSERFETPYLQLVMARLWEEELRDTSLVLRSETLKRLGGAERIVRTHVDAVLDGCSPAEQDAASQIFHYLVTPSRTKIAHKASDLAIYTDIAESQIQQLLERLSAGSSRLLSPVPAGPGETDAMRYQIFHDVLAPSILDWRARYIEAAKQAKTSRDLALIQSVASAGDLPQLLTKIAQNVVDSFGADNVTLYEYFEKDRRFRFPPTLAGEFIDPSSLQTQVGPNEFFWKVLALEYCEAIDARVDPVLADSRTSGERFVDREAIRSSVGLALRAEDEVVGLLFANYRSRHEFVAYERRALMAFASAAAVAIKSVRTRGQLNNESMGRRRVLDAMLATFHQARLPDEGSEEKLGELILEQALLALNVHVGAIFLHNRETGALKLLGSRGLPWHTHLLSHGGIPGRVARTRLPMLVSDCTVDPDYEPLVPETRSELAVPLLDGDELIGVLDIQSSEVSHFSNEDLYLLDSFATQAVMAFRNLRVLDRLNQQFGAQLALSQVLEWIARSSGRPDTLLLGVLTGVTSGEGLGFSRAALFALDVERRWLLGLMAVGSLSQSEAVFAWNTLARESPVPLREFLDRVMGVDESVFRAEGSESSFTRVVKGLRIRLEATSGALAIAVLEQRPILVDAFENDSFRQMLGDTGEYSFLCVPVVGSGGEALGVLVVDNRFLPYERAISSDAIPGLQAFAALAAVVLRGRFLQPA